MSLLERLEQEQENIEDQIIVICGSMEGGVTWNEAWAMSPDHRNKILEYLKKKMEAMSGKEYM